MLTMPSFFISRQIRAVHSSFKDLFDELGFDYRISCTFLMYFLFGCSTLSELVRRLPLSPSVSALGRYAPKFKSNRIMHRNRQRILKKMAECGHSEFCFAVDDTANPKYSHGVYGSASFGSSSGLYFGQKVLVLVVVDLRTRHALPIAYTFLKSKRDPDHIPSHECAVELLATAIVEGFPPFPVVADSWFDSKDFIKAVCELGCDFAGELKSNRLARVSNKKGAERRKLGSWFAGLRRQRLPQTRYQKRAEKRGKVFSQKALYINGLDSRLKIISVYNRINGKTPFAYYATTDLSMTGARLWKLARARWAIEVLFRDLKQSLGFGSMTAGGQGGAHMAVCIPLILATSIRLESSSVWGAKKGETLGAIVMRIRENGFSDTVDAISSGAQPGLLARMQARRQNPTRKPTNACGTSPAA